MSLKTILVLLVVAWQATFYCYQEQIPSPHTITNVIGIQTRDYQHFSFFYHHFGVFPVAAPVKYPYGSKEDAERFVRDNGASLLTDTRTGGGRVGNYGKLFMFYPELWLKQNPTDASTRAFAGIFFTLSLCVFLLAALRAGHPIFGIIAVVLLGSHPLQLTQVYGVSNNLSLSISCAVLLLGLCYRWLKGGAKPAKTDWFIVVIAGLVCGFCRQVRTESSIMILSVAALILLQTTWPIRRRVSLVVALVAVFLGLQNRMDNYFERKFTEANQFVVSHGGVAYPGPRARQHIFWHPIYVGLADFDDKYGIEWHDFHNFSYAMPLFAAAGLGYTWSGREYYLDQSYDETGHYPIFFDDLPLFHQISKDRFLNRVKQDPSWYVTILGKRAWRILSEASEISLALGKWRVGQRLSGFAVLTLVGFLILFRQFFALRMVLFTAPLSILPFAIFSGSGLVGVSVFHVLLVSAFATILVLKARIWYRYLHESIASARPSLQS
jgi:hypothetical protein